MNKKFLSAILFGALMITSTGTFVSCKDYDDDIDDLQSQVDTNKSALESQLSTLQSALTAAQNAASTAQAAADAAKKAADDAKKAGDDAMAEALAATALANEAKAAVEKAKTDAITEAIAKVQELLEGYATDEELAALAGQIAGIEENLSSLMESLQLADHTALMNIMALQEELEIQKKAIENLQAATGNDAALEELWAAINGEGANSIMSQLGSLASNITALQNEIDAMKGDMDEIWAEIGAEGGIMSQLGMLASNIAALQADLVTLQSLDFITNLAIIPELYAQSSSYAYLPTIDFYTVKVQDKDGNWNAIGSSNTKVTYRVNPSNVNQENYTWSFINRIARTRAVGDMDDLITIVSSEAAEGSRIFKLQGHAENSNYYYGRIEETGSWIRNIDIVALKATNEDGNEVVSDYATVRFTTLSNHAIAKLPAKTPTYYYKDVKPELSATADTTLVYNAELDLNKIVAAWEVDYDQPLADFDVENISYQFSLPEKYEANDAQKTNQQWFVQLENGILKANSANLTESLVPAIGRTPIVLVKAFVGENFLDSAYIKVQIVDENVVTPETPDKDAIIVEMGAAKEFEYHALTSNWFVEDQMVLNMSWEDINNKIYGKSGLTSTEFWNKYGGTNKQYNMKLTTIADEEDLQLFDLTWDSQEGTTWRFGNGFDINVGAFANPQTTTEIKAYINNYIKTENTYDDIDGKGAEYTLTITIPSNNKKEYADFKLVQKFYVKEDCKAYTYNPLYYYDTFEPANTTNCIVVKGQLNSTWEMSSVVSEHFAKLQNEDTEAYENIWQYYNKVNNVNALSFAWADGTTGVTPTGVQTADFTVALDAAMTKAYEVKNMTYKTTLVNGETCDFNYNIVFVNPFKAGASEEVKVYGNGIGENYGEVAPQVSVIDAEDAAIYSWVTNALALSEKATDVYKVAAPTVEYAFDTTNADYKELIQNITANTTLAVDAATGKFTWKNEGSTLKRDYVLPVIAKVTFANLSEVKCVINVRLSASK